MTDQEIITQFEGLVQDSLDSTLEVQLANLAKDELEAELQMEIHKKLDTSQNTVVGSTYLTPISLPTDINVPLDTIYVGTTPRRAIPLERRMLYKDSAEFFYVDWRQLKYYLCGTVAASENITFPYIYTTDSITAGSATTVTWPSRFRPLIAMTMAFLWFAIDQGEKQRSFSQEWLTAYQVLKNGLITWDQRLKLAAISNATPYGQEPTSPSENRINF